MKMMKWISLVVLVLLATSCKEGATSSQAVTKTEEVVVSILTADVKDKSFNELFTKIEPTDLKENVFKLVGEDYTVITSGDNERFNSMIASWGGWGQLFNKPSTWCFLRANRYTLEFIREKGTYTMSYFEDEHKGTIMEFGTKSGRNTDKMQQTTLTMVETPTGSVSYKEAKLIIECSLAQLTTVSPDDFRTQEGRDFVTSAYEEAKDYHKLVIGEITGVWIRK